MSAAKVNQLIGSTPVFVERAHRTLRGITGVQAVEKRIGRVPGAPGATP